MLQLFYLAFPSAHYLFIACLRYPARSLLFNSIQILYTPLFSISLRTALHNSHLPIFLTFCMVFIAHYIITTCFTLFFVTFTWLNICTLFLKLYYILEDALNNTRVELLYFFQMTRLAVSFITHAMPRLLSLTKPSAPISRRPPRPICNNNHHGRNMTSQSSDGLFVGYPEFTEEGFKAIDDATAQAYERTNSEDIRPVEADKTEESFQSEIDGLNLNNLTEEDWAKLDNGLKDVGETTGEESSKHLEASFASEIDGLNMGTLTEDEFAILDAAVYNSLGEPSIRVGFEPSSVGGSPGPIRKRSAHTLKSPLGSFRRNNILSVTDLTAPVWYVCGTRFAINLLTHLNTQ